MKLTAADAGYAIGAAELLHGISLDINPGELIIAVGPNGAGKSTMMKLLSGEIFPSLGQVAIDGIDLKQWQLRKLARIMAVLPQQSELNFPFRVHEVVSLGRIPHATGRHRDLEIVEELLVKLDINHLAQRDFTTLSGGEKQRTQIARILAQIWDHQQGTFILLDEPTSSLDLAHQQATLKMIKELTAAGAGVFVILHDMNLAAQFADRLVLLHRGGIVSDGDPWSVLSQENIKRVFDLDVSIISHPERNRPLIIA
ncbi:MAG: heme ABC transporter ATP-binding protein [Pseudomonadales bacterium]|jgi:iron complex transport system ATP-binding protein|nr:heme ABC transporter ATP-binding protein [Pseudomonadales bacterium]MDP7359558.1 heme ABC transporter ATP-binding protein [Pseudomonadales bacterium]MDP7595841.1 heme ABC transporter ATP-binding protein [Pseudomonadales bacterium]HJN49927.1 heme ABC transporter ATP-binding protein [Pseudomonadales bacterium]|tara:strand:- start:2743 stop:3510 length:768 start_codon:yes stop_codon:yes gene_type:complete